MSAIQIEKLDRIIHRFANVEHELSSGPAGDVFVKLSKEYAELEPTAKAAQNLKQAYTERRDVEEMLKAGGELAAMAEAEREASTAKSNSLNMRSAFCCLPRMPPMNATSFLK